MPLFKTLARRSEFSSSKGSSNLELSYWFHSNQTLPRWLSSKIFDLFFSPLIEPFDVKYVSLAA